MKDPKETMIKDIESIVTANCYNLGGITESIHYFLKHNDIDKSNRENLLHVIDDVKKIDDKLQEISSDVKLICEGIDNKNLRPMILKTIREAMRKYCHNKGVYNVEFSPMLIDWIVDDILINYDINKKENES